MKDQITKLVALACLAFPMSATSQTVNWASLTGSQIVNSEGEALDSSFVFELGAFSPGFVPTEANIGDWGGNWNVFDTADYSYNPQDGGYFTGTQNVQNVANYSTLFQGLAAFIWIRDPASTEYFLANATTKPGVSGWTFPNLVSDCCANAEVTTWSVSDLGEDAPVWGSQTSQQGPGTHDPTGGPFDIQTHAIPEPTTSALVLLACSLGLMRRRK